MKGFFAAILLLAACQAPPLPPLPEQAGPWRLESRDSASPQTVTYRGPVAITVAVHTYNSETVAFEAFQKWQVAPGTMPFFKGRRLFVPAAEDRQRLQEFVAAFQPMIR